MATKEKSTNGWVKPWLALREKLGAYQALVVQFTNMETDEYIYGNFFSRSTTNPGGGSTPL